MKKDVKDIFISYRRDGGENLAQLIYFQLSNDGYTVFLDVESLRAGKFNEALYERIEECTDFVLILPPNAMDRCKNEGDWLRLEIAHALKHKKNIIPIMMAEFKFPEKKDMPEDIREVSDYHGLETHRRYYPQMLEDLKQNFLHSGRKSASKAAQEPQAQKTLAAAEAESLIYVKEYFRCPQCGSRRIGREDHKDSIQLFLDGSRKVCRWLMSFIIGVMTVAIIVLLASGPPLKEILRDYLSQIALAEYIFSNQYTSEFTQWTAVIAFFFFLPGVLLMLLDECVLEPLCTKAYTTELREGPHTVNCRCKNCGEKFQAVSSDKLAEDWEPEEP